MIIENVVSDLVVAAHDALADGCTVSVKIDGEPEWLAIEHAAYGASGPALIKVRRASNGHTLLIPANRIIAVDVGAAGG